MKRRQGVSIANALLVIGLAVSVIGLMAAFSPPADPAVSRRAGDRAAPTAGMPESRHVSPAPRHGAGQGDARLFLRDAAAATR